MGGDHPPARGEPPTGVPMVVAELRRTGDLERAGGEVRLSQLAAGACGPGEVEYYADLVHGYAALRRYQGALARGLQAAQQTAPTDVPDAIRALQADLDFLAADDGARTSASLGTTWTSTCARWSSPSRRPP
ncbi:hypothetical protein WJ438_07305 [Streptomyces sp. GD-15H]|uniref:hypothetical protein n=1 Tax=Streptomyces sp. GD-15H TaxID=3129112 RepID=UPI003243F724